MLNEWNSVNGQHLELIKFLILDQVDEMMKLPKFSASSDVKCVEIRHSFNKCVQK